MMTEGGMDLMAAWPSEPSAVSLVYLAARTGGPSGSRS
jgi:hypothetical protein